MDQGLYDRSPVGCEVAHRAVSDTGYHLEKGEVALPVVDGQVVDCPLEEQVQHCWMNLQFLQYTLLCAVQG